MLYGRASVGSTKVVPRGQGPGAGHGPGAAADAQAPEQCDACVLKRCSGRPPNLNYFERFIRTTHLVLIINLIIVSPLATGALHILMA